MAEPDMVLISELLEEIHRNPPAVAASKLLVEHYTTVGWLEAALEKVIELKRIAPNDPDIARLASTLERRPQPPVAPLRTPITPAEPLPQPTGRHVPQAPISSRRQESSEGWIHSAPLKSLESFGQYQTSSQSHEEEWNARNEET